MAVRENKNPHIFITPLYISICTLQNAIYFCLENCGVFTRGKLRFPFGLTPKIPDPVPKSAFEPSGNHIKAPCGYSGYLSLQ
jgi:hypothetical protein